MFLMLLFPIALCVFVVGPQLQQHQPQEVMTPEKCYQSLSVTTVKEIPCPTSK